MPKKYLYKPGPRPKRMGKVLYTLQVTEDTTLRSLVESFPPDFDLSSVSFDIRGGPDPYDYGDGGCACEPPRVELVWHGPEKEDAYQERLKAYKEEVDAYKKWYAENKEWVDKENRRVELQRAKSALTSAEKEAKRYARKLKGYRKELEELTGLLQELSCTEGSHIEKLKKDATRRQKLYSKWAQESERELTKAQENIRQCREIIGKD